MVVDEKEITQLVAMRQAMRQYIEATARVRVNPWLDETAVKVNLDTALAELRRKRKVKKASLADLEYATGSRVEYHLNRMAKVKKRDEGEEWVSNVGGADVW